MTNCNYGHCVYEETIPAWRWRQLLSLAREHDINCGGYCDGRSGCINFWCGPDDQPDDPDWKRVNIRKGALNFPRSYVGGVHGDHLEAEGETDPNEYALQRSIGLGGMTSGDPAAVSNVGGVVRLHWVIAPSEKAEAIVGRLMIMEPVRYQGRMMDIEDFGTQADLDWCRGKFEELSRALSQHQS